MKKVIILGQKGNLAVSLLRQFPNAKTIGKNEFLEWLQNPRKLKELFSELEVIPGHIDIFNCAGITSAKTDITQISLANYELPVFLSEQSTVFNYRLITFGTVMEQLPKYAMSNSYLESKLRFYKQFLLNESWTRSNLHIQMHTLYGGSHIHPHMFLGQIYSSLVNQVSFKMTGGEQIREYHHVDDVAKAIKRIGEVQPSGLKNISSGEPMKLKDIATAIFSHFDETRLLYLSSDVMNENDNRDLIFQKPVELQEMDFRPTTQSIIRWLEELGVKNERSR